LSLKPNFASVKMLLEISISWPFILLLLLFGGIVWFLSRYFINRSLWKILNEESDGLAFSKSLQTANHVDVLLKKLLQKRSSELKRLQQLEEYRRQYTGNVAHELRTPIFAIQGYIESIIDDEDMDAETTRHFLKNARKNTFRLEQIITDLDTINKFESKVLKLKKSEFDMYSLFKDVVEGLAYYAEENKITFQIEGCKKDSHIIYADRDKIEQVLVNLGMNSIKYGNKEGLTKFSINDLAASISVEVSDNGIGIEKKSLNRIFERFYRADTSRSRSEGGSGLGLSICKHIIEAHNKKLFVFSTVGVGSVFSFQLDKANS